MKILVQKVYKALHELGYERESLLSKKQTTDILKDIALANSVLQKIDEDIIL